MSQPVGDLVVKIDGDSAKFDEEVAHLNKQLSGLGRAANDSTAQVTAAFTRQERAAKRAGISIGQYNNAMRMLPAQLTDVATQLAGGQSPWLILLQQGGQVKDSFGGLIPTFRGLLGAVSPLAVGVAALTAAGAGIGYIFYQGTSTLSDFNKTLTLSGNTAGLTTDRMLALAKSGQQAGLTFDQTTDSLTALINAGVGAGARFDELSQSVAKFSTASGIPIEKVAEAFGKLTNDPTSGLIAMAQQFHNVTNDGLTGSGLLAQDSGGVVLIAEASSPWLGGNITSSSLPVAVFGDSPVFTSGTASSGGSPAITANVTLAYGSATGVAFSGIPEGTQRLALAHRGNEYRIADADGTTATVQRLIDGVVDPSWSGFSPRTMIDYQATGISDNNTWMGPFLACPESEVVDAFEVNFSFPSGICGFDSKGKKRIRHCEWEIQYRVYGSGSGWTSRQGVYALKNINGLGFTERFDLSSPGLVEVRCRRRNEQGSNNARDSMYWQALRGRLLARPTSYAGVTLMGVTVETGGKLAAQSDRRVNVVATRIYDSGGARSISGALYHVGRSLGMEMDTEVIDALEQTYWTPNGEYFDFATGDSISALEMLQKIAAAGKSYFLLNTQSVASVGREGVKPWTGAITPHEMVSEMQTDFSTVTDDDYDGVDVTYINGSTWAEETVQCRLPGNPTPLKIEAYRADGVGNPDHAYQIGMRRLRKYQLQRMTHKTTTELDALCYNVGDRIVLTDDIPGSNTVSCLIESMTTAGGVTTFDVSEPLDWTFANPRVYLRYQDGKASRLFEASPTGDNYQVSVPYQSEFADILLDDPIIEPPRLIFCSSESDLYHAIVSEIVPQDDGTCEITARQYRAEFYDYDDATYPGDVA